MEKLREKSLLDFIRANKAVLLSSIALGWVLVAGGTYFYPLSERLIHFCILFLMFFFASVNKAVKGGATCVAVLMGLYILAFRYGPPSPGVVVSLLNTNADETFEFLWQTPRKDIFLLCVFVVALGIYIKSDSWLEKQRPSYRLLFVLAAFNFFLWGDGGKFANDGFSAVQNAWGYQEKLLNELPPDWKFSRLSKYGKYKNYVVVLGESVRLDVFSVYGSKWNTTPYLNEVPGDFYGMYAASWNTQMSLPRMLALPRGTDQVRYGDNVISLANMAGFQTYWISNQGHVGTYDSPISFIAEGAKYKRFLKQGAFSSANIDDDVLIDELDKVLADEQKGRVIFLHMMGSHKTVCDRLFKQKIVYGFGKERQLDCYYSSINKLDNFIKKVAGALSRQAGGYSLVYISDHGQTFSPGGGGNHLPIDHGMEFRQDYFVPLLQLRSDASAHVGHKDVLNGFDFLSFYADWLGLKILRPTLAFRGFHRDTGEDRVFNGTTLVRVRDLQNNPPL